MCLTNILVVILIIIIIYDNCISLNQYFATENIKSNVDGQYYKVVKKYDDRRQASNIISEINLFGLELINNLEKVYILNSNENTLDYTKGYDITLKLLDRYPNTLTENDPTSPDKTSFTKGKGELISLCLREKASGNNEFHGMDIIKFVLLHEMAHVVSVSYQHTNEFWINFKFLLQFCEKRNIYFSKDYKNNNTVYCGLLVKYNPVFDSNIPSYF